MAARACIHHNELTGSALLLGRDRGVQIDAIDLALAPRANSDKDVPDVSTVWSA
jgi:hypothetical protein